MDTRPARHARRRLVGHLAALVAAVLVVPALTSAPANAAVTDPLTDLVTPVISGAGQVTGPGLSCVNTSSGQLTCADSVELGDLDHTLVAVLESATLTATPADGWEFGGWSGACTGTSPTCTLDAGTLTGALAGTPLTPVATFLPADDSDDPLCQVPEVTDCDPPVTKLGTKPAVKPTSRPAADGAGVTQADTAAFTFQAFEPNEEDGSATTTPTEGATFECKLAKKSGTGTTDPAFAACPGTTNGSTSYSALTDGTYEFSVRALDEAGNADETPETFTWTVDTTAPETELNTRTKFWVLARKATFGLDVTPPDLASDVSFQCYLDGAGRECPTVRFAPGTHTFGAAATDEAGNTDETPVTHTFTMPLNNTDLNHSRGWKKAKVKGTFLRTASITSRKGAKVATKEQGITRIALVASKGRGFGTVKVMLGKKTLKKVSLARKRDVKRKVIPIARFSTPVNGKVTVTVVSRGKKVVLEGLGIATR